jgi:hypothetical protein
VRRGGGDFECGMLGGGGEFVVDYDDEAVGWAGLMWGIRFEIGMRLAAQQQGVLRAREQGGQHPYPPLALSSSTQTPALPLPPGARWCWTRARCAGPRRRPSRPLRR